MNIVLNFLTISLIEKFRNKKSLLLIFVENKDYESNIIINRINVVIY